MLSCRRYLVVAETAPATWDTMPGLQPACDAVQARATRLLEQRYGELPPRELARSFNYSRSMVGVGAAPQRDALVQLVALGLVLLAKLEAARATAPAPASVCNALRLQAPGPSDVDNDGLPVDADAGTDD